MVQTPKTADQRPLPYLQILWKRKSIVLVCFLVLLGVVAIGTLYTVPLYESTTTLVIEVEGPDVLSIREVVQLGERNFYSYKDYYQTQYKIMQSRAIAQAVLQRLSLPARARFSSAEEPVQALLWVVSVDPIKNTRLVNLSALDKDPVVAAEIANAFAEVYVESNLERRAAASEDAIDWLAKRLEAQKSKLGESEAALQAYRETHQMIIEPTMSAEDQRVLVAVESLYAEKAAELANLKKLYGPKHPQIVSLSAEIEALQQKMQGKTQEALALNRQAIEYGVLKREVETNRHMFDSLLTRLKETHLWSSLKANNVAVLDRAEPPLRPAKPILALNIGLAGLAGLVLGIALALLVDLLDTSLKTSEEVEAVSPSPVIGTIPVIKVRSPHDRNLICLTDPTGAVAERYRALRTNLLYCGEPGRPRTILITSANPSEGKTITATNLAIAMAQAGSRVALVDADLRRPSVHRVFELSNAPGLTSWLIGEAELDDLLVATEQAGLKVIPAGVLPPNPAELLSSRRMGELLKLLKERFDVVILDSPPVLAVTDASILSSLADQIVHVVLCGSTAREALRLSCQHLAQVNAHIVGVVLNRIDRRTAGSPYRYYHYYSEYHSTGARRNSKGKPAAAAPQKELEPVNSS